MKICLSTKTVSPRHLCTTILLDVFGHSLLRAHPAVCARLCISPSAQTSPTHACAPAYIRSPRMHTTESAQYASSVWAWLLFTRSWCSPSSWGSSWPYASQYAASSLLWLAISLTCWEELWGKGMRRAFGISTKRRWDPTERRGVRGKSEHGHGRSWTLDHRDNIWRDQRLGHRLARS